MRRAARVGRASLGQPGQPESAWVSQGQPGSAKGHRRKTPSCKARRVPEQVHAMRTLGCKARARAPRTRGQADQAANAASNRRARAPPHTPPPTHADSPVPKRRLAPPWHPPVGKPTAPKTRLNRPGRSWYMSSPMLPPEGVRGVGLGWVKPPLGWAGCCVAAGSWLVGAAARCAARGRPSAARVPWRAGGGPPQLHARHAARRGAARRSAARRGAHR